MRVIDPGHKYLLHCLDEGNGIVLPFVKREGPGYPGNHGHYPGTHMQDVYRVLIDRTQYLNKQIKCWTNWWCILFCRLALNLLEYRAAKRHKRRYRFVYQIETLPFDSTDGHVRF